MIAEAPVRSRTVLWVLAQHSPVTCAQVAEALGITLQHAATALRRGHRLGQLVEVGVEVGHGKRILWGPASRASTRQRILAWLSDQYEPATAAEAAAALDVSLKSVVETLRRMEADRLVLQVGSRKRTSGAGRGQKLWVAA